MARRAFRRCFEVRSRVLSADAACCAILDWVVWVAGLGACSGLLDSLLPSLVLVPDCFDSDVSCFTNRADALFNCEARIDRSILESF